MATAMTCLLGWTSGYEPRAALKASSAAGLLAPEEAARRGVAGAPAHDPNQTRLDHALSITQETNWTPFRSGGRRLTLLTILGTFGRANDVEKCKRMPTLEYLMIDSSSSERTILSRSEDELAAEIVSG